MEIPGFVGNLIPLVLSFIVVQYSDQISRTFRHYFTGPTELVIGVLSARGNFGNRQAIRDTWWKYVEQHPELKQRVELRFVIGSHGCPVPVEDRDDEFWCVQWKAEVPDVYSDLVAFKELHRSSNPDNPAPENNYGLHTVSIRVRHPVILSKLGLHSDSIEGKVTVRLLDAAMQTEIVSTVFSKESPGVLLSGYRYKAVEPYLLPKGFEGMIVAESLDYEISELPVTHRPVVMETDDAGGVIHYVQMDLDPSFEGHYTDPRAMHSNAVVLPSFILSIHEIEDLKDHVATEDDRQMHWIHDINDETEQLRAEHEANRDLLMLPMVDTYRNLPQKLLLFFQWLTNERHYSYAMKVDDDCYVDVEKLLSGLTSWQNRTNLWWGRFRHNWVVEHQGKWTELKYKNSIYPAFACGSGSVFNRELVAWMSTNKDTLMQYQGEDVSVGIWLSAIGPEIVDDPLFQCKKECISNMYTMPELTPGELQQLWGDRMTCGDPCGCP